MARILVVADDLTGGNATGALFARLGLRTVTVGDLAQVPRYAGAVDVLVVNTGSRRFTPEEGYAAVHAAVRAAPDATLVVKRVDTTLRGNPGRELDAVLDALTASGTLDAAEREVPSPAVSSTPVRVLAVPAFPDAGRTTVGGIHLVDGVPLTRTPVARDLFASVRHSRVASVLGEQSTLSTAEVPLDVVENGVGSVLEALRGPGRVLVCDATDNEHLRTVAAAAARLTAEDGTRWITLDSGPFGAAFAAASDIRPAGPAPCVLAVVGSATDATDEQLARTEKALGAHYVPLDPDDPAPDPLRTVRELEAAARSGAGVVGVRVAPRAVRDPGAAERILRTLAEVAARAVEVLRPGGLYTSGGDVAAAVTRALGAEGFEIEAEVLPLAVAGHLAGGPHGGLPFATKGGLIGGPDAAVACLERLRAMQSRGAAPVTAAPAPAAPVPGTGDARTTAADGYGSDGAAPGRSAGDVSGRASASAANHRPAEGVSP